MALVENSQYGQVYQWGITSSSAPQITGMVVRSAEITYEPEVMTMATDGEGHVDSITRSKIGYQKIVGSFTGYLTTSTDPASIPASFSWTPFQSSTSRVWLIGSIKDSIKKGDYAEITVEATSYAGISSATPNAS